MKDRALDIEQLRRGGLVKLKDKDMFSMWVKTSCCNLNSAQLRKLASITEHYGRGYLLFTTRQIPIIPHVNLADTEAVKRELAEVYLELDRCGARVRNVNVCYEDKICPQAVVNPVSLGEKLDSFFRDPILHKIKAGVSGCGKDCTISRMLCDISFIGEARDGSSGYDAYLGGRLGVSPFVGIKLAEHLSEDEAVRFVQNYFDLLKAQGRPGERAADLLHRLGADAVRIKLTASLSQKAPTQPVKCQNRLDEAATGSVVLRVRATCGEVTSGQLRKIAGIADRFGQGFVHFAVRGAPEIPCIKPDDLAQISDELQEAGLRILDSGIDNIQSCFGNYCGESLVDPQSLLRRIERKAEELELDNRDVTISGAGCPNSCGIAHLSDIGFHGVLEPEVDTASCNGCGLCVAVCKRKAIRLENDLAIIDQERCASCGVCVATCPLSAIVEKRRGFAVLVGGRGGEGTRLGQVIARYISDEEALRIAESYLKLVKSKNKTAADLIDEMGIQNFTELLTSTSTRLKETRDVKRR